MNGSFSHNTTSSFLPPTNEVWGKVIFLHLFVILFMGGGVVSQHALWYPSMHCRWYLSMPCSRGGVLSQHALQQGGLIPGGLLQGGAWSGGCTWYWEGSAARGLLWAAWSWGVPSGVHLVPGAFLYCYIIEQFVFKTCAASTCTVIIVTFMPTYLSKI